MKLIRLKIVFISVCCFLYLTTASAVEIDREYITLANHGNLVLQLPKSWNMQVSEPQSDLPPTLYFTSKKGEKFEILISPLWKLQGMPDDFLSPANIHKLVKDSSDQIRSIVVEKKIQLQDLRGINQGYYFGGTDKAPKPGEYLYMIQGSAVVGELLCTFTILTEAAESPVNKLALDMIRTAVHRPVRDASKKYKLNDVLIKSDLLGKDCAAIDKDYPVSIQAGSLYRMVEKKDFILAPPEDKTYQSFNCGGNRSTIYYYQYSTLKKLNHSLSFIKALIWGEGGRSDLHPEMIFSKGNVLVVISSSEPAYFELLIP